MSKLDEICKLSLDWITVVPGVILITLARLCTIIFSLDQYSQNNPIIQIVILL